MLSWQGGGHRRRFVPRKEPLKTSGASFSRVDFRRAIAWRQARGLNSVDPPLKQPVISLRPGSYSERGGSPPRGRVARFTASFRPPTNSVLRFSSTFFCSCFLETRRTCARTPIRGYRSPPMMADSASATPVARISPRALPPEGVATPPRPALTCDASNHLPCRGLVLLRGDFEVSVICWCISVKNRSVRLISPFDTEAELLG